MRARSPSPRPPRAPSSKAGGSRSPGDSGQVLLLGVLFMVGAMLPLLASVGVASFVLPRDGAQDAAAPAGASQAVVTKKVDVQGNVHAYTAQINPQTAPGAWAWDANAVAFLGGTTAAFHTSIDNNPPPGQGPSISVVGAAKFPDSLLALIGLRPESTVTVQAVAGTCGGAPLGRGPCRRGATRRSRGNARTTAPNSLPFRTGGSNIHAVMREAPRTRNPYRPGAAVSPLFLAGRDDEQRRFQAILGASPELPANVRITGLRGVGKTVLLKRLAEQAEDGGWLCNRVQVEPRHNTNADLTDLVTQLCQVTLRRVSNAAKVRQAVEGVATVTLGSVRVAWHDVEFSFASGGARELDVAKELYSTVATVVRHGYRGYLLMLDEAQVLRDDKDRRGSHPLSLLIAAVSALQEKGLPIGLTVCGLPTLRTNLLRARTYTERMFRGEEIGRLAEAQAVEALVRPLEGTGVKAEPALVSRVVREAEGYPYFIQLWGAALWDAAQDAGVHRLSEKLLDSIEGEIYRRLDIDFYDGRVDALTPAEQDILLTTAHCPYPPLRTADILRRIDKREGNVNVLMGRLVEQGIVFRVQKGQYEYTAPQFYAYLQRRTGRSPAKL